MTRIIGRTQSIGIGKEAVRGTAVAPTYWIPVRDMDFDDNQDTKDNESGFGTIDAIQDHGVIKQWGEGSFSGKIYDLSEGAILRALFGQAPVSVQRASSGTYDHTFSMLNSNQHASASITVKEANNDIRFPLAVVDSYSFEAALDDYVNRSVKFMSKKSASSTSTVAYTNENEFLPKHMVVKLAAVGGDLTAAAAIKVRNVKLDINKNAEGLQVLGSNDLDDVANKQLEVSGSFEAYYDDTATFRAVYFADTHKAVRIDVVNTDVTIGSTNNPSIRFDIPEVVFTNWEKGFDNNDVMTQTIEFKAVLNLSAGYSIQGRLTNQYAGTNYA